MKRPNGGVTLLAELRRAGCSADRDVLDRKMKGQMKAADREQARYVVILGEEELGRDTAVVKEMATGRQEEVRLDRLVEYYTGRKQEVGGKPYGNRSTDAPLR